ncbi:hypothetical protein NDU88_008812 [Pleurodeles waltl]|uniref:Uncharacterized protein n=1 Tax=Pleurodeles waltl TaxID=8319 RepID=A0AAV7P645_PLEWA|nr:hypothetical protein NDU88_008812 [Pleurodeles waltl]
MAEYCGRVRGSAPALTYPGGTDQGAGVGVKPLRHDGSRTQGAEPLVPGRHREIEFKERPGEGKEFVLRGNPTTEEETGGQQGITEEDEFGGGNIATEEETGIGDGQQGAPKRTVPQGEAQGLAPVLTYPGGTDQGAVVAVKPLRHNGSATQGAEPLVRGRRRKVEFKEQPGEGKEFALRGNPTTEEETGGQ